MRTPTATRSGDGDSVSNGGPHSHTKTYDEDLATLIHGAYGATGPNTRIMYVGDLNMYEDAQEWEDMVRRLRNTCVPSCSGGPESGCVHRAEPVLKTDHKLLITKVRTAF